MMDIENDWLAVLALVVLVLVTPLVSMFGDDAFYGVAYRQNGAYDRYGEQHVWAVTKNFQDFLSGDVELLYFYGDEAQHLYDVKALFHKAELMFYLSFFIVAIMLFNNRRIPDILVASGKITAEVIAVLLLLGLNWEWFFTQFHELFFSGNWIFASDTLMIGLWGGDFFVLAALYAVAQSLLLSLVLILVGGHAKKFISRR